MATVEGDFRAHSPAEPESARGIEQAVASVIAELQRHGGDQESLGILDTSVAEDTPFIGCEPFAPVRPCPLLLPNEVAQPLDVRGEVHGLRLVGGEDLMRERQLGVEGLVALTEVGEAQLRAKQLLGSTGDAAQCERAFRVEEVAVSPIDLCTGPLPSSVAELPGYRM